MRTLPEIISPRARSASPYKVIGNMRISKGTLKKRNGTWHCHYSVNGRQIRRSLRTSDKSEAISLFASLKNGHAVNSSKADLSPAPATDWEKVVAVGLWDSSSWLRRLHQRCKDRAKAKGIYFSLSIDELELLALQSAGMCPVTGIAFNWSRPNQCKFPPFAPVLDRVHPPSGYCFENCRIVSNIANVAMSDWGESVLVMAASALWGKHAMDAASKNGRCT